MEGRLFASSTSSVVVKGMASAMSSPLSVWEPSVQFDDIENGGEWAMSGTFLKGTNTQMRPCRAGRWLSG